MSLGPGQRVSHFRLLQEVGRGGMGVVYLARDERLDRDVALKFLSEELERDRVSHERFLREARAVAALDHPYICGVYEIGEDNGRTFIAMEYVHGRTLEEELAAGGVPLERALTVTCELAEALRAAHGRNIVHRDLKPANLMLAGDGHVKVMDFGLAKQLIEPLEPGGKSPTGSDDLTQRGAMVGTWEFMSPEQVRGDSVDPRSDVFAVGVLLYRMITGISPFRRRTPMETTSAILSEHPPPIARYAEGIPELVQHTVRKMLAKDPVDRYQSVLEVCTNLRQVLAGLTAASVSQPSGVDGPPSWFSGGSWSRPWRRDRGWILAGLAAVLIVAWLVVANWPAGSDDVAIENAEARLDFQQALNYEHRGYVLSQLKMAERKYRDALAREPHNPRIQARLALLLERLQLQYPEAGREEAFRSLVASAAASNPEGRATLQARARLALLDGDADSAVEMARRAAGRAADDHEPWVVLGEALIAAGREQEGLDTLRRGTAIGEGHVWARASLARALLAAGQLDEAAAEYRRVLRYAPDFASALNNLGTIYLYQGRVTEAIRQLERLLELQPDEAAASNLGTAYFQLGQFERAADAYRRAIELAPGHPRPHRNLGEALEEKQDAAAAGEAYARCVDTARTSLDAGTPLPEFVVDHAFCTAKLGNFDAAAAEIDGALANASEDPDLLYAAAQIHAMAGQDELFFEFVRRALGAGYPPDYFRFEPCFRPYQSDPAFLDLLTRPEGD